jgi:long-chain acyl-CoA synthetase
LSSESTFRKLLLSGGLHASAWRNPRRIALRCEQRELTYEELSVRVSRVAGALRAAGIQRGDRIAVLAPNCLEYLELIVGIADAGAIAATLNPRSTAHELAAACDDCGARLLFVHATLAEVAQAARFASVERVIGIGDEFDAWRDAAAPAGPDRDTLEWDPFTLVYSSGTTGRPKGIMISHRSRALTFHGMAMEYGCYGPDDLQLGIAPMAHGAGFAFIAASVYFGGTVEVLPRFDAELVLRRLASEPFTGVFMVPTHFQSLFALESATLVRYRGRARSLRAIISNAAALPQAMKERIVEYFGPGLLHETYGSTEAGIVTNLRPAYQLSKRQSVGPAFALNRIRLLDASGRDVQRGGVGELFSNSPYLFSGYWRQPEEETLARHEEWVTAGDLARQDDDGFYYIVDRKKDVVITGGINVYPREIEEVLHQHPAIRESAVVGVADERWGEALCAYVVVKQDMNLAARELDEHCRKTLAAHKVPKEFRFIDALPRNASGKVLKRELR